MVNPEAFYTPPMPGGPPLPAGTHGFARTATPLGARQGRGIPGAGAVFTRLPSARRLHNYGKKTRHILFCG